MVKKTAVMNKSWNIALIFSLVAVLMLSCNEIAQEKPNVLMICVDDLNDWIGCMGGHPNALTPNMDQLASRGVLFTNAHCQAPLCGPSRASVMTGLRPSTTGIYRQILDNDIRDASDTTKDIIFLPAFFKRHGYHTMGIGKIFHQHAPDGVFDESGGRVKGFGPKPPDGKWFKWNREGTSTDWGAFPETDTEMPDYQSAEWAVERLNRHYDRPFFLAVGFLRPHVPWYVPQKWFDMHPVETLQLPPYREDDLEDLPPRALQMNEDLPMMPTTEWAIESGEWKNIVQAYLACVTFVDHYIGEVLNALEKSEHKDNTIVLLWSDHGYRLGEKGTFSKHCLWQEATNAPLIISTPGMAKSAICTSPVEMLDIYPTLLDLCGLPDYEKMEGKSLRPLLENPGADAGDYAVCTFGRKNHAVISGQFRYIQYEDGSEEFYDHGSDPNEWTNRAGDTIHTVDIQKMKKKLPATNAPLTLKTK